MLQADYVMGSRIDEPLTMTRSSTTYYYNTDGLGNVRQVLNSSGTIVESYDYDPYGQVTIYNSSLTDITSSGSGISNPYMFTGRRFDEETGIYHYRARQYDPAIGRFLQRDPLGYWDSMNLYAYVRGNPINYRDPYGLFINVAAGGVGALVGAIAGGIGSATKPGATAGSIIQGAIVGGITGLISGGTMGIGGPLTSMASGAIVGALGNLAGQTFDNLQSGNEWNDYNDSWMWAAAGGAMGAAIGGASMGDNIDELAVLGAAWFEIWPFGVIGWVVGANQEMEGMEQQPCPLR